MLGKTAFDLDWPCFREAEKLESFGRLAGGVAHDFNNMLGVILGHSELIMAKTDPSQPLFAALQEIRKAAERSADLTHQLLAFARKQRSPRRCSTWTRRWKECSGCCDG